MDDKPEEIIKEVRGCTSVKKEERGSLEDVVGYRIQNEEKKGGENWKSGRVGLVEEKLRIQILNGEEERRRKE